MRFAKLPITAILLLFFTASSYGQHDIVTGKFTLTSIDTIGPYYVLKMANQKDTITVLSLINPGKEIRFSAKYRLKINSRYDLELQSMRAVRVSADTNVVALINLRGFILDGKLLLKANEFPYSPKNIYKIYYLPQRQ